ncbi:hypothetical protein [Paenibacillus graminis]|nr:hypothetical protein [Paenibacillus graminis]MEC0168897.1 hypothetical protein [Paenibacillus graminis]
MKKRLRHPSPDSVAVLHFIFNGAWRTLHEPCGSFKWKKDH